MRRALLLCLATVLSLLGAGAEAGAQATGTITGTVRDEAGAPVTSANVVIAGTRLGASTATDGRYRVLGVPAGMHTVTIQRIGYVPARRDSIVVGSQQTVTVDFSLKTSTRQLQEVVVVGYGTRSKETLTGAISSISGDQIQNLPTTNVSNTLGGRLPGLVTVNSSGEPGYNGSSIRVRGSRTLNNNNALIVVDGVPDRAGGLEQLNPDDLENITVLKDASAAIYGSRAANGVILVTTKRGRQQRPEFSMNLSQAFSQPTRTPKMADAATYMTMLNEIDVYRNRNPRYTPQLIQNYRDGADPWLYPNTDWFREVIKPLSQQTRGEVALRGGAERIGYFLSVGGLTEDGYYRNSGTRYNRYNIRSNIDGQPTDNLNIRFDLSGRLEDRNFPARSAGSIFRSLMRGKPNLPAYWPNGLPGPDIEYGDNPVVISTPATGYTKDDRYFLQGNLGLDVKVPGVTGLTLRGHAAYDRLFRREKNWRTPWTLYSWDYRTRDANGGPLLQASRRGYNAPELNQFDGDSTGILLNLVGELKRQFGEHRLGILGGTERQMVDYTFVSAFRKNFISDQIDQLFAGGDAEKNNSGSASLARRQNYFTRINYDFADRYLFEFIGRFDGSYIFPEEKRFGFFPAFSAGWRVSQEPFFRRVAPFMDNLKLRTSWGQTGNDRIDEWQYLSTYGFGGGYVFGDQDVKSIYQIRTPNPNVTWEVANQFDVGVEGALLSNRLTFELDYFRERRTDILWRRNASVPQTTGLSLPRENIGKVASGGIDGTIGWHQQLQSDVSFDVTVNGGYSQNKILFWDEAPGAPEWQRSTGGRMRTDLFYDAIGVFKDSAALAAYPRWPGARPGDIIFRDVNGDGKIDAQDRIRVNKNDEPTFVGGLTFRGQMRSFDLNVFFQGATGAVQYLLTESGDIGNYLQDFAENRWTPTNPSDRYPRTYNRQDEYWIANANTFFLRDADYLRLKTLQLGYRVPANVSGRLGMQTLRLYVGGYNLMTWDTFHLLDPEVRNNTGQYYPQQRTFNMGTSLTF
jgi:TonB-linked SusC/RagA family outer membrane protein